MIDKKVATLCRCKMPHCISFSKRGFTLIEILIVLGVFSVLAAIALPLVRNMISEQKGANASRSISSFIDLTRRRAIAESRPMGILIERLDNSSGEFSPRRGAALRIRQMRGVPGYTGEASNAIALLHADTSWPPVGHPARPNENDPDPDPNLIDAAVFDGADNQLLLLSARMNVDDNPPILVGDPIEFPGGRIASITRIEAFVENGVDKVKVNFDLEDNIEYNTSTRRPTQRFPAAARHVNSPFNGTLSPAFSAVKYKIYRSPVLSTSAPFNLPNGLAIDLNYSGVGATGNDFAPREDNQNANIIITFGADGSVVAVRDSSGTVGAPTGLIFLCLGETDGLRPDSLLTREKGAVANLVNQKSIWIVINPSTGRVVSSPFASVDTFPGSAVSNPNNGNLTTQLREAREFAFLADTVDSK